MIELTRAIWCAVDVFMMFAPLLVGYSMDKCHPQYSRYFAAFQFLACWQPILHIHCKVPAYRIVSRRLLDIYKVLDLA